MTHILVAEQRGRPTARAPSDGRPVPQSRVGHLLRVVTGGTADCLDGDAVLYGHDVASEQSGIGVWGQVAFVDGLPEPVAEVAGALSADPDSDARLFTGPRGGRISTAVLRDATHWADVVTKLGHEHLRRHDLRHTGLTWFADAGVQVHVLRRIAGHGSPTTTQRHLHPGVHKITAAGAALSAHFSVLRAPRSPPIPIVVTR